MKKYNLMLGLLFLTSVGSIACDVCGGMVGILPNENKHSVSLFYRYRAFKNEYFNGNNWFPDGGLLRTEHSSDAVAGVPSYEVFRVAELRGRLMFHKKWDLIINLPYTQNKESVGDEVESISGIGDMSFFANRYWSNSHKKTQLNYRFSAGFGFKLPSGKNNNLNNKGQRISLYNQTGTGSLDYLVLGNIMLGYKRWGLTVNSLFRINNYNLLNERIGPIASATAALFRKIKVNDDLLFTVSINAAYEHTRGIQIGKNWQKDTSMKLISCGSGLQIVWKNISFESQVLLPAYEPKEYNSQMSMVRFVSGFVFNI
jgi:hypothetical protein